MLAIHNPISYTFTFLQAANAFAKLSKCQQFTTISLWHNVTSMLQTLLQSYQNVSNSQLYNQCHFQHLRCKRFCKVIKMLAIHNGSKEKYKILLCCKRFCKVIKMLAIHNTYSFIILHFFAANAFAKLSKCQQFTTSA